MVVVIYIYSSYGVGLVSVMEELVMVDVLLMVDEVVVVIMVVVMALVWYQSWRSR